MCMIIVGVIWSSLSWLVWPLYLYVFYGILSIVAILLRVGVEREIPAAILIDRYAPETIRLIGMRMSNEVSRRVFYSVALVTIGWLGRDSWEFHHTFVLTDLSTIAQPGDTIVVRGKVEVVAEDTWWFQRNSEPIGQAFPGTFCKDFVPGLKRGDHVDVIVYSVPGILRNCWTVRSTPLGIIYK